MELIQKTTIKLASAILCAFGSLFLYVLMGILVAFLSGCAQKEPLIIEKTKEYAVPTKCNLPLSSRPTPSGDIARDVKNLAIFAEESESVAISCGAVQHGK